MVIRNHVVACAVVAGWCAAPLAWSQSWPDRPIRMLVGFPPGGSTDLAARIVANKLSQALGQTVIVENRAGASGNIAADAVAQAAPDGYTLMMAATSFAAAPAFFDKLPWDPTRNFTPIAQVATVPSLQTIHQDEATGPTKVQFKLNGQSRIASVRRSGSAEAARSEVAELGNPHHLGAPMPGSIVTVPVAVGQRVHQGATLLSLESMKMETHLIAERESIVERVLVKPGDRVQAKDS